MKSIVAVTLLGLGLLMIATTAHAECQEEANEETGEFKTFFKNLGCKISKGAEDLGQQAKPFAEKIAAGTKEFGQNVAQKYDELKHKLTDDAPSSSTPPSAVPIDAPTEKVPLAPLHGGPVPVPSALPSELPSSASTATGELNGQSRSSTMNKAAPESIDNRFLLQSLDCPKGEVLDHRNMCRPKA